MMKEYAVEYMNPDGDIVVTHFNENGPTLTYTSQGQVGKWKEPKLNQMYVCSVLEPYNDTITEDKGYMYQYLATFTLCDEFKDEYAADRVELFKKADWQKCIEMATNVSENK